MTTSIKFKTSLMCAFFTMATVTLCKAENIQTVKNMERERADVINTLLDQSLSAEDRNRKINMKLRRLVDLERMVLRDSNLEGNTDVKVRRVFQNYDLSFLAHGSIEQNKTVAHHWLDQVGLDQDTILNGVPGAR